MDPPVSLWSAFRRRALRSCVSSSCVACGGMGAVALPLRPSGLPCAFHVKHARRVPLESAAAAGSLCMPWAVPWNGAGRAGIAGLDESTLLHARPTLSSARRAGFRAPRAATRLARELFRVGRAGVR